MADISTFLSARQTSEIEWCYSLPVEMHGAFGGAFGGLVCACCVLTARETVPGRTVVGLDCRLLRGLPAGDARTVATVLHSGRSLACVAVDVFDERGKLSARGTVSLVDAGALSDIERPSVAPPSGWVPFDDAPPWPAVAAPIVETLSARSVGSDDRGYATGVRVPWDSLDAPAEAACLAADMSTGMPIGAAMRGERVSTPNPDLSVRFCGEVTTRELVGVGRVDRAAGGVAAVAVEVWSGSALVANGVSTSLLLPTA